MQGGAVGLFLFSEQMENCPPGKLGQLGCLIARGNHFLVRTTIISEESLHQSYHSSHKHQKSYLDQLQTIGIFWLFNFTHTVLLFGHVWASSLWPSLSNHRNQASVSSARVVREGGAGLCTIWQLDAKKRPRQHCARLCQMYFHNVIFEVTDTLASSVADSRCYNMVWTWTPMGTRTLRLPAIFLSNHWNAKYSANPPYQLWLGFKVGVLWLRVRDLGLGLRVEDVGLGFKRVRVGA